MKSLQELLQSAWASFVRLGGFEFERGADEPSCYHCRQQSSMDCGEACARMVLKFCSSPHELALGQLTQPCWSVDLFIFLKQCGVDAVFFTLVRGFSPDNQNLAWYGNNMRSADIDRCNEQFALAERRGWDVQHAGALTMADIATRVSDPDCVAVVLVDDSFLKRRATESYAGHYVLLTGCDGPDTVVYLDPATDDAPRRMSRNDFDTARSLQGTDCDIVFCRRRKQSDPEAS